MKKKFVKAKQQQEPEPQPESTLTQTQTPLLDTTTTTTTKTFRKILQPSFKLSSQYDLELANKRNIHFKRTRLTHNFDSNNYKRLIKRNLKYIRRSEISTFGSRPSLSLLQEVNHQELNQYYFPRFAEKQKIRVTLGLFGHSHGRLVKERDMISLFRFLCKNNVSMRSLKLFHRFANNRHIQKEYMKYLTGITSLEIQHNGFLEWENKNPENPAILQQPASNPDLDLNQIYHQSIAFFGRLERISLDFTQSNSENAYTQSFLCDVIKMLSQIPSLKAIEITMTLTEVEKKVQKLKPFTEKLKELKSLKLNIFFGGRLADPGKAFTTILPLPTLKHLSINLGESNRSSNCADLAEFIGSMKNLETFEFECESLLFEEYLKLFQAIQKLKSLTKLSVIQITPELNSFAYGLLFKTLNTLKKLTSININLGYAFDDNELNAYPQHLLKHPALKRAKVALQVHPRGFNLTNEFFVNLHRLRERLDKLHLTLVYFPEQIQKKIKEIVIGNQKDLKHFNCPIVELPLYFKMKYSNNAYQVNNNGNGDDDDYDEEQK